MEARGDVEQLERALQTVAGVSVDAVSGKPSVVAGAVQRAEINELKEDLKEYKEVPSAFPFRFSLFAFSS